MMGKHYDSMITVGGKRKFDGKVYELASNQHGTNLRDAETIKSSFLQRGYKVRKIWNGTFPYIYPEGRYFVYVRKPSARPLKYP